jgi:3-hydroxymyristoyl/3-hydroxydecanoyl-(acyl carrier protein) dehydratase
MTCAQFRTRFRIANEHPALPGHFPDRAVVPGVILLDHVAAALATWRGARIASLPQVKFLAPLLPDQEAELVLDADGTSIRFSIFHDAATIASGIAESLPLDSAASGALP